MRGLVVVVASLSTVVAVAFLAPFGIEPPSQQSCVQLEGGGHFGRERGTHACLLNYSLALTILLVAAWLEGGREGCQPFARP